VGAGHEHADAHPAAKRGPVRGDLRAQRDFAGDGGKIRAGEPAGAVSSLIVTVQPQRSFQWIAGFARLMKKGASFENAQRFQNSQKSFFGSRRERFKSNNPKRLSSTFNL
jgi:hypothetical protein